MLGPWLATAHFAAGAHSLAAADADVYVALEQLQVACAKERVSVTIHPTDESIRE